MALITCKECKHQMSSMAGRCPNCGAIPLLKNKNVLYLIFVIALGLYVWFDTHPVKPNPPLKKPEVSEYSQPNELTPRTPEAPPINVSSTDLWRAYQSNEVKADMDYKGKKLAVFGMVGKVEKDIFDYPVVMLNINGYDYVRATFPKIQMAEISALRQYQSITITCIGDGVVLGSPKLDCRNN